jgi:hypothetical protein
MNRKRLFDSRPIAREHRLGGRSLVSDKPQEPVCVFGRWRY